jgi:ABC-type bacteriocin/lantibiotic exporter with double-glycine peptidase domain
MTQRFQVIINNFGISGSVFNVQTLFLLLMLAILIPSLYLQQFMGTKYSELCDHNMRVKTFATVSRIDMQVLDSQRVGDILSRANDDLGQINWSLQNYFAVRLPQEIIGVVTLLVSTVINWQLTIFSLAIVPVFMVLQIKYSSPLTRFVQQRQNLAGESLSIANNLMGGYEVAKAFNMGETLRTQYNAAVDSVAEISIHANRASILLSPFSQILFFLPQIVICGFGVYLASIHQITPGGIMAVIILSASIRNPISNFSSTLLSFKTARGCASRVFELWDMLPESSGGSET